MFTIEFYQLRTFESQSRAELWNFCGVIALISEQDAIMMLARDFVEKGWEVVWKFRFWHEFF
jgi:hypothetical protein